MTQNQDVFSKKHEDQMAQDKRAILEEMNLPPAVIDFLRKNAQVLKISVAVLVVAVVGWEWYGHYSQVQKEQSSSMLFSAIQTEDEGQRSEMLNQVVQEYGVKGSGAWGSLELGHMAFRNGQYQEAISKYQEVLASLSKDNALYPLVQYCIAQAYDNLNDEANTEAAYSKLLDFSGFAAEGYLGLGRYYEGKGDPAKALEMYETYVSLPDIQPGITKNWVDSQIARLKADQS